MLDRIEIPELKASEDETKPDALELSSADEAIQSTLLSGMLGHVIFDGEAADNTTSEAMASADCRTLFRREVYVGIKDTEQNIEFLGRIVQGPFHIPHEAGSDTAKTRTSA